MLEEKYRGDDLYIAINGNTPVCFVVARDSDGMAPWLHIDGAPMSFNHDSVVSTSRKVDDRIIEPAGLLVGGIYSLKSSREVKQQVFIVGRVKDDRWDEDKRWEAVQATPTGELFNTIVRVEEIDFLATGPVSLPDSDYAALLTQFAS